MVASGREKWYPTRVMKLRDVVPDPENPRVITDAAMGRLVHSIQERGLNDFPIWNDREKKLVAGHKRVEAMLILGWDESPFVIVDYEGNDHTAALVASNAEYGRFDDNKLRLMIERLNKEAYDIDGLSLPVYQVETLLANHQGDVDRARQLLARTGPAPALPSATEVERPTARTDSDDAPSAPHTASDDGYAVMGATCPACGHTFNVEG